MTNKELLKEVWERLSFDEIIDAGFEYNKCSGEKLINAAAEFEYNENNDKSKEQLFIDKLRALFEETNTKDLPWARNVMEILYDYYDTDQLLDYFDNDDMIDHCDGSWEMDRYIKDECNKAVDEYKDEMSELYIPYTRKDFMNEIYGLNSYNFKRFMCDIVGLGYCVNNEEILNTIKEKL